MNVFIHTHSLRLKTGEEALVTRVVAQDGRIGYGFTFDLDATAARHMAEWEAGLRKERPQYTQLLNHPWEEAWHSQRPIDWTAEPAFALIPWRDREQQ